MTPSKQIKRIREEVEDSDRFFVARRVIPELLDVAMTDDQSRGLRGTKDDDELELIQYIAKKLGDVPKGLFDQVNKKHDEISASLKELNEGYGLARQSKDLMILNEARQGLILDVVSTHPSKAVLVNFSEKIDTGMLSDTHSKLLKTIFFDMNPNLGYLINEDNNLDIQHVLDTLRYVDMDLTEKLGMSGSRSRIQFNKKSQLSRNQMKHFIHECKENDGKIENFEVKLISLYGELMFGYDSTELLDIAMEIPEENNLVESLSQKPSELPRHNLGSSDLEKRVRKNLAGFIDITRFAFNDNQFTAQEEAICQRVSKYYGIRTKKGYYNLINYCMKKVVIANGNTQVSDVISNILNRTAITPNVVHIDKVLDYVKNNNPIAVVVDLDKGEAALNLILGLRREDYTGRVYAVKSKGVKPGTEKALARQYGVDMLFSLFKPAEMKDYITQDLGIKNKR